MSESSSFCLFFFLILITVLPTTDSTIIPNNSGLIDQTCEICANQSIILDFALCSTSLESIPLSQSANLQALALIAMELALDNASSTISTIEKLLMNEEGSRDDDRCLRDCLEVYSDAVWIIVNSAGAFLSEKYETARTWMSSAMEAASTCQGGFEEKGEANPLTKENYDLFQLCGIALCIIHMSTPAIN